MTALVKVVTPRQYEAWVVKQKQLIADQNAQVAQLRTDLTKSGGLTPNGVF
jgi:heme/copper-type cytochrome/quinol oxidase subunit 2